MYIMCESVFLTFLKPLAAFPMRKGILELGFFLYDYNYIHVYTSIKSCAYILCACQLMYIYVCTVTIVEYIYLLPHYVDVVFLNQFNLQPRRHSWDKAKPVSDILNVVAITVSLIQ